MKQRVVIAMAPACNPKLLLADGPATAPDVTIQAQVPEMIAQLKAKLNTSLIFSPIARLARSEAFNKSANRAGFQHDAAIMFFLANYTIFCRFVVK